MVPAFNEGTRIGSALRPLIDTGHYQVVVVNDGASDETADAAGRLPVWLFNHLFNCGQGASLRTGIEFAISKGADDIVTFDADGQHDADDIQRLLEPLIEGRAEVASGSRFAGEAENIPLSRLVLLKAAVIFTRLTTGLPLTDAHNGFQALTRKAAQTIQMDQPRMAHASEILDQIAHHQLTFEEVPVTIRYSEETLQKGQSAWDAARIGGHLILERLSR